MRIDNAKLIAGVMKMQEVFAANSVLSTACAMTVSAILGGANADGIKPFVGDVVQELHDLHREAFKVMPASAFRTDFLQAINNEIASIKMTAD